MVRPRVLCVDDDPNILSAFRRTLRAHFDLHTEQSAAVALEHLEQAEPYAVIVSDKNMPGMDGIQFLSTVRTTIPTATRILLTGESDQRTAVDAINEGQIFRFLVKPCPADKLQTVLAAAVHQHRLVIAERELLEHTLRGSIRVLSEVLSLANPTAFGRAARVKRLVMEITVALGIENAWQIEIATMLSQLGCITVPEEVLTKMYRAAPVTTKEASVFEAHTTVGSDLIRNIPRLEEIAEIVAYQETHYDGGAAPRDHRRGDAIPLGARILKLALDFDSLLAAGNAQDDAIAVLRSRSGWYDPKVLKHLEDMCASRSRDDVRYVSLTQLRSCMILGADVRTVSGMLLIAKGQELTPSMLDRVHNFARLREPVREPIPVVTVDTAQVAMRSSAAAAPAM